MKNNKTYIPVSIITTLVLFIMINVILSGCSNLINQSTQGEGKVVITLNKGSSDYARSSAFFVETPYDNNLQVAGFDPDEINTSDLPRSITQVLDSIEGYLVKIKGPVTDICQVHLFDPDQNQMTVSFSLPAGNHYNITLLALGNGDTPDNKLLLGGGQENFVVTAGQINTVPVPMLPYKYSLQYAQIFTPNAVVPASFYLLGPLLDEIFALDGAENRVYYSKNIPESNFNQGDNHLAPEITPLAALDNYDCYRFQVEIPSSATYFNISDGASPLYETYLQLELKTGAEWQQLLQRAGLAKLTLLVPDHILGDGQIVVSATPEDSNDNNPTPTTGTISTIASYPDVDSPEDIIVDSEGNIYVAAYQVIKIAPDGTITPIAGTGESWGYDQEDDGGLATDALLWSSCGLALDTAGNLYIADGGASVIRKVSSTGIIDTIAGIGSNSGYNGDGIAATTAKLDYPKGVAVDGGGNLYIADTYNHRIRKVDSAGIITTLAGTGTAGYNGDGDALSTQLNQPQGIALDGNGNLYIAEYRNNIIRKLDIAAGTVSTVAGGGDNGNIEYVGEATGVQLAGPRDVALDSSGNLYIADAFYYVIRKVENGIIRTVAGSGNYGTGGDGGPATEAELTTMNGVAVDDSGNIYISDYADSGIIRKVTYGN